MSAGAATRVSEASLRAHGDRVALEGPGHSVRYRTFAGRARAVADLLDEMAVASGERVAILSRARHHDEAVALAGIHLHGASAVPLDPTAPHARQARILRRAGCRALVHDAAALGEASRHGHLARIELDEEGFVLAGIGPSEAPAGEPDPLPPPAAGEAMLLHTSGTTAAPKAVPLRWEGLDAFVDWMTALTATTADSRILRVAELCFDLSLFDHLAAWKSGATLCTAPRRAFATPRSLTDAVRRARPTVAYAVPSWWMRLCEGAGGDWPASLQTICFAGETFPPKALEQLAAAAPEAQLYNLFGPTETNVCCYWTVQRDRLDGRSEIPIGGPCPYAACTLVDAHGAILEGPGVGELVVSGPTAVDPAATRTGDRVRRSASGELYFAGRIDRMLKIAGHRVDPHEVEATLRSHPSVHEAAVVARTHPRLGPRLVAFVTVRDRVAPAAVRKHLAEQLPTASLPDTVEICAALPRTSHGKIDYAALANG